MPTDDHLQTRLADLDDAVTDSKDHFRAMVVDALHRINDEARGTGVRLTRLEFTVQGGHDDASGEWHMGLVQRQAKSDEVIASIERLRTTLGRIGSALFTATVALTLNLAADALGLNLPWVP